MCIGACVDHIAVALLTVSPLTELVDLLCPLVLSVSLRGLSAVSAVPACTPSSSSAMFGAGGHGPVSSACAPLLSLVLLPSISGSSLSISHITSAIASPTSCVPTFSLSPSTPCSLSPSCSSGSLLSSPFLSVPLPSSLLRPLLSAAPLFFALAGVRCANGPNLCHSSCSDPSLNP